MLDILYAVSGSPFFIFLDICVILAAVIYLFPFENKTESMRRGIAFLFFAAGFSATVWGDLIAQTWGLFLLVGAIIGLCPDMGEVFGRSTMMLYWGHASKMPTDYGAAKKREELGDYDGALSIYRYYADHDPEDQNVRLKIAITYSSSLKRPDLAWYWFDKVLSFKRNNENEVIACVEKVRIALAERKVQEAQGVYYEMLRRFPNHISTQAARDSIKQSSLELNTEKNQQC